MLISIFFDKTTYSTTVYGGERYFSIIAQAGSVQSV